MVQYKPIRSLAVFIALVAVSACGPIEGTTEAAQSALRAKAPDADWNGKLAASADVTCDGASDFIFVGRGSDKVWLGLVPGNNGEVIAWSYLLGRSTQNSFCAPPVRIDISDLECVTEAVGNLDGCRPVPNCKAFSIVDEECDSFHFYWNADEGALSVWRL